ncbi:Sec-independent protein translocase protein TatC [compost metagenome]
MKRDEDEIEQSAAPLLEHLIELRRRLIWAILAFFLAFILCFAFAKHLFICLSFPINGRSTGLGWIARKPS